MYVACTGLSKNKLFRQCGAELLVSPSCEASALKRRGGLQIDESGSQPMPLSAKAQICHFNNPKKTLNPWLE